MSIDYIKTILENDLVNLDWLKADDLKDAEDLQQAFDNRVLQVIKNNLTLNITKSYSGKEFEVQLFIKDNLISWESIYLD